MSSLIIHDETSAPEAAKATLAGVRKSFGFIPNVLGELAGNPAVLDAYLALSGFAGKAGFSALETPLNPQFEAFAWTPARKSVAVA